MTAKSFIKSLELRELLEAELGSAEIRYLQSTESYQEFLVKEQPDAWIVGRELVNKEVLSRLNNLQLVSKYGVGVDNINSGDLARFGIALHCEMGVNSQSVAEFTIGLMVGVSRNLCRASKLLSEGTWWKDGGRNFSGSKVGIVGCGHVGSKVALLAAAFGCEVYINDIIDKSEFCRDHNFKAVDLSELLRLCDFVSLHVPLTEETHGFIDLSRLKLIGKAGYLINTCRGEVVDQESIKKAINNKYIAGVASDVFESEPLEDEGLYGNAKFVGTPHIAGNSREAVLSMGKAAIRGVVQKIESL